MLILNVIQFRKAGAYLGGALGAWAPRGHQRGAKKKEKRKRKERERGEKRKKEEREGNKKEKREDRGSKKEKRKKESKINMTRGAPCSFKCKQGLQGRKRQGRQIDGDKDERGAIVSSASRGSSEENVRGAKLTEKRTRGAPCSFKCKQGLQGRKRQGRQIDGEKDERGAMQFQVQAGTPGKKTSGAAN